MGVCDTGPGYCVGVWVEGVVCGGAGDFSLQDSRLDLGGGLWDAHY